MPKNKAPRKQRTVKGRVEGCDRNPMEALAPPSGNDVRDICVSAFSNHALLKESPQDASPEGAQMIVNVLDVGRELANRGYCLNEYAAVWDKARDGAKSLIDRHKATGKLGYDGWAIEPIGKALAIHQKQLQLVSKKVILDVIQELQKDNQHYPKAAA